MSTGDGPTIDLGDVASGALTGHGGTFSWEYAQVRDPATGKPKLAVHPTPAKNGATWVEIARRPCERNDMDDMRADQSALLCVGCGYFASDHPHWDDPGKVT